MLAQPMFQSGEFYNQYGNGNFWTIVGLFVTLFGILVVVSILVIKIQLESDLRNEGQRLLAQERLIMDGLRVLFKPIKDQIKTLVTLANRLKKPEDLDHSPDAFVTLDSKTLRERNYSDPYQSFLLRKDVWGYAIKLKRANLNLERLLLQYEQLQAAPRAGRNFLNILTQLLTVS